MIVIALQCYSIFVLQYVFEICMGEKCRCSDVMMKFALAFVKRNSATRANKQHTSDVVGATKSFVQHTIRRSCTTSLYSIQL
jgi:hypothetical protein